jgi:hypothetical protein
MLEEPDTNATDGSSRPRVREAQVMHDWRKNGHALTTSRMPIIPSKLPQAEIRDSLAPMIGGANKGTFIPVTFALVPEAREAMKTIYSQLVADFPFDKDVITPFGGERDTLMCKFENMFKEISNRSLVLKHALWKGDLWLVDDLANDNYFSALDARVDLEAERYAMHTKCTAYKDKRRNASSNGSSVIADLTFSAAKYEKTRSDFYSKSGAGSSFSNSWSGSTSGGGSWTGSGWSHPTVTGPLAWTYSQPSSLGTYPCTNEPPNRTIFTGTGGGTGAVYQTTGVVPRTRTDRRRGRLAGGGDSVPPKSQNPKLPESTP